MIRPTAPMGRPLTDRDASAGQAMFGSEVPAAQDAIALRDARGIRFQRLEFLGDSVLDLLALRHRVLWTLARQIPRCCAGGWFDPTDRALAVVSRAHLLTELADWPLADERAADLVEACVGAGFRSHGWAGATRFAGARVHPIDTQPERRGDPAEHRRLVCELGAQVFDAHCTAQAFGEHPDADEGELSTVRAGLVTNRRRARLARRLGLPAPSTRRDDDWADQLDFELGRVCVEGGVAAADGRVAELSSSA
jgi:hypothetical protein